MFCPRCAAHNIDDARYCRVCGADISLLPQVLSGEINANLAVADESTVEKKHRRRKRKGKEPPTLENAYENIGVGLAFLLISIMIAFMMPGGRFWWFWMLIPAGACAGEGIGQLVRIRREKALGGRPQPPLRAAREESFKNLPPLNTSEIVMPPPSITEGTTRHLNAELPARNLDEPTEQQQPVLDSKMK